MTEKLEAGAMLPSFSLPAVGGGEIAIGGPGRWQLRVIYRGKHCPLCLRYLTTLDGMQADYAAVDTEVVAISGDPEDKARATAEELALTLPVGYDLSVEQMRTLGLYVSQPRSVQETDRPFAEPGAFVVNPEGKAQVIDISNAPFARPDLASLLRGIGFIQEKDYPIRGTA